MDITLFGTALYARARSVEDKLDEFLAGEDALVVQYDEIPLGRDFLVTVLKLPALVIGAYITALLMLPLELVLTRGDGWVDKAAFERVAGDRPVHFVSDHRLSRIAESGWPWLVGNWVVLLGAAVRDWRTLLLMASFGLLVTVVNFVRHRQGYPRLTLLALCVGSGAALWLLVAGYLNGLLVGVFAVATLLANGWADRGRENRLLDELTSSSA